jgi:2-polyprenyl-3-methyl-5-hydroxy-6-metoxy-1,4-benzoquinol methylase
MHDRPASAVRVCGDEDVSAGRVATQLGWYEFAHRFVEDKTVLDVGCGLGDGLRMLELRARVVHGQDLDPRLSGPGRFIQGTSEFPSKSYDVVVTIDVLEHVEDAERFVKDCARIAREGVFLSTPNWTASRCHWPFHFREYTPREFERLLQPYGEVLLFKGTSSGDEVYAIRHRRAHHLLNALRNFQATAFPARVVNRLLPRQSRIHSSNAAWVRLR